MELFTHRGEQRILPPWGQTSWSYRKVPINLTPYFRHQIGRDVHDLITDRIACLNVAVGILEVGIGERHVVGVFRKGD